MLFLVILCHTQRTQLVKSIRVSYFVYMILWIAINLLWHIPVRNQIGVGKLKTENHSMELTLVTFQFLLTLLFNNGFSLDNFLGIVFFPFSVVARFFILYVALNAERPYMLVIQHLMNDVTRSCQFIANSHKVYDIIHFFQSFRFLLFF